MNRWTEEQENEAEKLLKKYPSKTYSEIAEKCSRDTTKKALAHKNQRDWNIDRNVDSKVPETKKGSENPNWKGGKTKHSRGYILEYAPNHSRANNNYVFEHILVAEEKIGRKLRENEVVHHKNGDKEDNRSKNLEIMTAEEHNHVYSGSKNRYIIPEKEGFKRTKRNGSNLYIPQEIREELPEQIYIKEKDDEIVIMK